MLSHPALGHCGAVRLHQRKQERELGCGLAASWVGGQWQASAGSGQRAAGLPQSVLDGGQRGCYVRPDRAKVLRVSVCTSKRGCSYVVVLIPVVLQRECQTDGQHGMPILKKKKTCNKTPCQHGQRHSTAQLASFQLPRQAHQRMPSQASSNHAALSLSKYPFSLHTKATIPTTCPSPYRPTHYPLPLASGIALSKLISPPLPPNWLDSITQAPAPSANAGPARLMAGCRHKRVRSAPARLTLQFFRERYWVG